MDRLLPLWILAVLPLLHGESVGIRTADLPWAIVDTEYRTLVETAVDGGCPAGDIALSLAEGALPRGLEVSGGYLSGTPREIGRFRFSLRAANSCSSAVKTLELIVTGKPILRAFPEEFFVEYHAGQSRPAPLTVEVSATWPNLPYSVQVDAGWLTRKVLAGVTPGQGSGLSSDIVSLEIDPKDLAPGIYRASVRFSTRSGANSPVVAVTLKVAP